MISEKRLVELLESAKYRFAKTMPQYPHWYTLRSTWKFYSDFRDAVLAIRHYGKREYWFGREFIYYYAGEYKYWTMGDDLQHTILINRAEVNNDNRDKRS
jgi:hypothetical protein